MRPADIVETLSSHPEEVRCTLKRIQQQIVATPGYEDIGDTVQIVLAEALNNIVEHAYAFEAGHPIEVKLVFETSGLSCHIRDNGIAMPNGTLPDGDMPALSAGAKSALPEGGFGWAMIHILTDKLSYRRQADSNHLTFSVPVNAA